MPFGALIIGDEIIRGKRSDGHFAQLIALLAERGLTLAWAQFLGDDRTRLTAALRQTFASEDVVFSFGGIGATPDDHTRQAAATALNVPLVLHEDAAQAIRQQVMRMGREVTPATLEMGVFPQGATLIPNPYNGIPGFSCGRHHFLPGFPQMAWPMAEWALDMLYREYFDANPPVEASVRVWHGLESVLLPLMTTIEAEFAGVTVFSLPFLGSAQIAPHIELGVRGQAALIRSALARIQAELTRLGYRHEPI